MEEDRLHYRTIVQVLDAGISDDDPQPVEPYLRCDTRDRKRRLDALKQRIFDHRRSDPIFRCPHCKWPLFIAQTPFDPDHYIFKHFGKNPDKTCPWYHERAGNLRKLSAIRFGPEGESDTHRKMVRAIYNAVNVDDRFQDPQTKRAARDKITSDPHKFPDVQVRFHGKNIAFEAQWSRQYCKVVSERESFYRDNDWHIAWVFHRYPENRKLFANIIAGNRYNALELNNETIERTIQTQRFHLRAHWLDFHTVPSEETGGLHVVPSEQSCLVDIAELHWDESSTKPYFRDSFGMEVAARKRLFDKDAFWRALAKRDPRSDCDNGPRRKMFLTRLLEKAPLHEPCTAKQADSVGLIPVLQALRSIETGTVIGYNFRNPVEYANRVLDAYPWTFEPIIRMVSRVYGDKYEAPYRKAAEAKEDSEVLIRERRDFSPFYGLIDLFFDLNLTVLWWGNR